MEFGTNCDNNCIKPAPYCFVHNHRVKNRKKYCNNAANYNFLVLFKSVKSAG